MQEQMIAKQRKPKRFRSIRTKAILYAYGFMLPLILLICAVLVLQSMAQSREQQMVVSAQITEALEDSLTSIQREVEDLSLYLCINSDITRLLTTTDKDLLARDANVWRETTSISLIEDIIAINGYVNSIAIYPENGLSPYLRCWDNSAFYSDIGSIHSTDPYRMADGLARWVLVSRGASDIYSANRADKLVMIREIQDFSKQRALAFLAMSFDALRGESLLADALNDDSDSIVVFNHQGEVLLRGGASNEELVRQLRATDFVSGKYAGKSDFRVIDGHNIFVSCRDRNGSVVYHVTPSFNVANALRGMIWLPAVWALGLLIALLPLFWMFSLILTRPLARLAKAMSCFSAGDASQQVPVESNDEVGQLGECFNKLVQDINRLIEENYVITLRERESELNVLQAQINPHFLYNTLDSLYWRATGDGNEETADNIYALSQLFRIALSGGNKEIRVEEERAFILYYLQIQRMRFGARLCYDVEIDRDIYSVRIPKLILQPIVENAASHGVENADHNGVVSVRGYREGERIVFVVSDNGVGMTREQIDAIWVEEKPADAKMPRYSSIRNIRDRLALRYKADASVDIISKVGKGTRVTIVIPAFAEKGSKP